MEPHLEERLGVNLPVENHPAGGGAVAGRMAVEDDSCRTLLMWGIPHLPFSYMTQDVDFTYDDFAPLARVSVDSGVIRVHDNAPWTTINELIEDARARPGELKVAAGSFQDAYCLGTKQLEEATGAEDACSGHDAVPGHRFGREAGEIRAVVRAKIRLLFVQGHDFSFRS